MEETEKQAREAPEDNCRHGKNLPVGLTSTLLDTVSHTRKDGVDRFLSVILVLVIVIALCTTILVIGLPKENERFTDFFILSEKRTAEGYPYDIIAGQHYPIFIGVGNHERRNVTYTIETWNMNTLFYPATNTTKILTMDPQDRFSVTLGDNETLIIPYTLSVKKTDYNRVGFLLFTETTPDPLLTGSDRFNASYRDLYLRVYVWQGFSQESDGNIP